VKNQLPQAAEDPVLNKQAADSTALMYISFYSDQLSNPQITDYLSRVIQPKLATLPGMAEAEILGNQVFAMRLWLDPVKLAAYGVSAGDVNEAVRKYNFLSAAGEVKGQYVVTSINADTELKTPEAFAAIPLKTQGDSRVLLGDVARVEMGAESYNSISSFDGIPSVYIGIKGTPSANPLDVIKEVRAIMPQIEAQLPPGPQGEHRLRRHRVHPGLHRRGGEDPGRSRRDRHRRGVSLPRLAAYRTDPGGDHPAVDDRRDVLHAGDGLFDQPADPAGHGAGDRPGGGRRHRRGGEHPPAYRAGQVTVPGGHRRRTGRSRCRWSP
jgi:Cation/multidrug efflux pump